ncbi:Hsp20/alpha crystallin family protein [Haloarchaeobius iranensis]|uniref:HSP20 family protein n=1 Tax=Haloarchaeobius iranensis TaxID=996166 RepID=A0A1G9XPH5_9EURY|nr:Hsp20/alpha crystallin family protein [Haloarchaeobius iranensis]SDM98401.1 HSP20 family protein [Haloarchaeobius iranensis]
MAIRTFDDMDSMFDQMDQMFDEMRTNWMGMTPHGMPSQLESGHEAGLTTDGASATSLTERDGNYVFVMDLPGFEREDIELTLRNGVLHVDAATEVDHDSEFVSMHQSRRSSERVHIPGDIVAEEIQATYRNGVLEVHLPMMEGEDDHHISIQD